MKTVNIQLLNKTIEFPIGENILIFGSNGSGKTVLGKLLSKKNVENTLIDKEGKKFIEENKIKYIDCSQAKLPEVKTRFLFAFLEECSEEDFLFHQNFFKAYSIELEKVDKRVFINKFSHGELIEKMGSGQQSILNIWWELVGPLNRRIGIKGIYFDLLESHLSLNFQSKILEDIEVLNENNSNYILYITTHAPFIYKSAEALEYLLYDLDKGE